MSIDFIVRLKPQDCEAIPAINVPLGLHFQTLKNIKMGQPENSNRRKHDSSLYLCGLSGDFPRSVSKVEFLNPKLVIASNRLVSSVQIQKLGT